MIPVMVPALFVNAAQVPARVRAIPVLEVSNVIEDPVILLAAVVSLSTTTSLSPVAIVAVEVILPSLLKLPCVWLVGVIDVGKSLIFDFVRVGISAATKVLNSGTASSPELGPAKT